MSSPAETGKNSTGLAGNHSIHAYALPLESPQGARISTPDCTMLFWFPRFLPGTVNPPWPTQKEAWSVSPSQMFPPDPLNACWGCGTTNSAATQQNDLVLL